MNYDVDHQWHRALLSSLAYRMKPQCFIELGLGPDPVLAQVGQHCARAYGVDKNHHPGTYPNSAIFQMSTDEFFEGPANSIEPPELVFVDADHRGHQVLKDLAGIERICPHNCIVVLHDTFPENLAATADEFCSDSYLVPGSLSYEFVTLPFPPGITIMRLKPKGLF